MLRRAQKARLEARTASTLRGRQATYVECGDSEARAVVAGRFGFSLTRKNIAVPNAEHYDILIVARNKAENHITRGTTY